MPDSITPQDAVSPQAWLGGPSTPESAPQGPQRPATAAFLSRDAILEAPDLAIVDVEVPEWGGTVRVRALNVAERDAFEASCMKEKREGGKEFDPRNVRAKLAALTLVDENGLRMFQQDDIKALGRKSAKALARVFDAATRLNGLSDEDVKSLEGNSDGQDDDSSSDSPWPADEPTSSASAGS